MEKESIEIKAVTDETYRSYINSPLGDLLEMKIRKKARMYALSSGQEARHYRNCGARSFPELEACEMFGWARKALPSAVFLRLSRTPFTELDYQKP